MTSEEYNIKLDEIVANCVHDFSEQIALRRGRGISKMDHHILVGQIYKLISLHTGLIGQLIDKETV